MERAMTHTTTDVLICGAGAAGLTLAIELARRDVGFLLIDKAPAPFGGSRGKGIQPRSQEVFEDMGVLDRMVAAGGRYPPQRAHRDGSFTDEPMFEDLPPIPAEPYRTPLMLPQFLTEAILRERLLELGHAPRFGAELSGFTQDATGVSAQIGGDTIGARYLVGADGGRSFVRHTLGIAFPGKTLGIRAVVADLVLDGLSDDAWHRWNDGVPDQISLCPLRGTELFQLQAPVPLDGEVDLSARGLGAMVAARTGRSDIRVHAVTWASVYTMNARLADRYHIGRVYLAGDAAHIHPPTGGQGLNTSVQDAYNLGWKLAAALNGAPDAVLASYETERRPVAAEVLGLSTRLLEAFNQRSEFRRGRDTHQLDLGYPDSPLSLKSDPDFALQPGDRAPDAPCSGAGGQKTRLFNLFQGTHWTLLGSGNEAIAPRPGLHIHRIGGDIVDCCGHIREAYGEPGWILIRPDGYIAAIVAPENTTALDAFLGTVGLT
jgi:2-polyprenyl-6-methoxyphenol hydroxylase-like FAD-dependent oxidoreductase